jgi:DNA/RNA endonuclease YhcR with UshA esterase domain
MEAKMKSLIFAMVTTLALGAGITLAADDKPAASQPTSKPAAGAVVEVTDLDTIKANVGKELTVRGKCSGTYKSRTGSVILINFEGVGRGDFVAAVEKDAIEAVNAGFGGDITEAVKGKTLTITGPIKLYREKPEVVISKPDQVKIEADSEKKE